MTSPFSLFGYLWALPNSLIGFVLFVLYRPKRVRWFDGCLECTATRTLIGGPWVAAQTHGWVIFYRDENARQDAPLAVHERVHVTQALWGGVFFALAYGLHFLWLVSVGGQAWRTAYMNIWAEKQAYAAQADYLGDKETRHMYWGHLREEQ